MRHSNRPSGNFHWTRLHPEYRTPWTKLEPARVDELCTFYRMGSSPDWLAQRFGVGRTTVWRYAKAHGLVAPRRKHLKQKPVT